MAASNNINLGALALQPGEARKVELVLDPGHLDYGGQRYAATPVGDARVEISRMATGHALRLRFATDLTGPCMRCLADAAIPVSADAREVAAPGAGEELESPYVVDDTVQVERWAHDALALALPQQLLCRPDCAGLCPVCGESLNDAEPGAHDHEPEPDPRWDKLRELKLD